MGFYLRKALKFGPFRLNLSKSGVGASFGITGMRVGITPKGRSYLHAGRHGMYYRKSLSSFGDSSRSRRTRPRKEHHADRYPNPTVSRSISHGRAPVVQHDEISAAIQAAASHVSMLPFAIIALILSAGICLVLFLTFIAKPSVALCFFLAIATCGVLAASWGIKTCLDRNQRSRMELDFDLHGRSLCQWIEFQSLFSQLRTTGVKVVSSGAGVLGPKYHSGASLLVDTGSVRVDKEFWLAGVTSNVVIPALTFPRRLTYAFLPDRILTRNRKMWGRLNYSDLEFQTGSSDIICEKSPAQAKVVGQSWRYVRKDGGPDRRFRNNRILPIVQFAIVRMTTGSGMDHALLFTSTELATRFVHCLRNMAAWTAEYTPVATPPKLPEDRKADDDSAKRLPEPQLNISDDSMRTSKAQAALFDALCCLVFADGHCTTKERAIVTTVVTRVKAPWSEKTIHHRITKRWIDVDRDGLDKFLDATAESLKVLRSPVQQRVLRHSLRVTARADRRVSSSERKIYRRLVAALPSIEHSEAN